MNISVLIPAFQEELNLPAALASVAWADEIIVVDSNSSDRTAEIAAEAAATVVQFVRTEGMPKKKAWSLQNIRFRNDWILVIDADERVSSALAAEMQEGIERGHVDGFYVDREYFFMGRSLRCYRPNWNLRLFRRGAGYMEDLGLHDLPDTGDNEIHEHLRVDGLVAYLRAPLLHDDFNSLSSWVEKHNRYATWEAHLYRRFRDEPIGATATGFLKLDPFERKRILRRVWVRLPFRPLLRFLTWYFGRQGFRDGWQGFYYCVLMSWYEVLINLKLRELSRAAAR